MPPPLGESVVPFHERPLPITTVPTCAVPFPFRMPERVVLPVPPLATESSVPDQLLLFTLERVAREPRPETCPEGRDKFGKVVMPEIEVLAERRGGEGGVEGVVGKPLGAGPAVPPMFKVVVATPPHAPFR